MLPHTTSTVSAFPEDEVGRPTQFASKTGVGTTGPFLCSNDMLTPTGFPPPPHTHTAADVAHSAHSTQPALRLRAYFGTAGLFWDCGLILGLGQWAYSAYFRTSSLFWDYEPMGLFWVCRPILGRRVYSGTPLLFWDIGSVWDSGLFGIRVYD